MSHIWYFKGIPSRMGTLLDISPRALEKVLYFASYIVLDPGCTPLRPNAILTETEYRQQITAPSYTADVAMGKAPLRVGMGAAASCFRSSTSTSSASSSAPKSPS